MRAGEAADGQPRSNEGRGRDDARREPRTDRGEGRDNREGREPREPREGRDMREPRDSREPRGEGRGPRRDAPVGVPADGSAPSLQAGPSETAGQGDQGQRPDRGPRGERGEGRRERGERGGEGRRDRGERGPRTDRGPRPDGGQPAEPMVEAHALAAAAGSVGDVTDSGSPQPAAANAVLESHTHGDAQQPRADGEEPPRGRSRDRNGRDRRERGDNRPAREDDAQPVSESALPMSPAQELAAQAPVGQRYATGFASQDGNGTGVGPANADSVHSEPAAAVPAPRQERAPREEHEPREEQAPRQEQAPHAPQPPREQQAPRSEATRNEPAPARGLPQVQRFELPVNELAQVAHGSGLQWVNSDVGKIAAVQAAIAAEAKPIHIPRERPPAVVVEEAPLVLVETKRDLRDTKLPFEQSGTPPQQ